MSTLTHQDYTVGWICALPSELTAAMAMLDGEEHPSLSQHPADRNAYTLGRVSSHNVAIACLPSGQIGNNSAATVAAQMRYSFGSIRFGLLVGIGGGVPSEDHDIRLGDVVVSIPDARYGGVVQYDFGKFVKEGRFMHTSSLNAPPTVILTAISRLRAEHGLDRGLLTQCLSDMDTPMLQQKFTYQGAEHDLLFEAEYDHVDIGTTCEHCDITRLVKRDPRYSQDPVVHYGTIASGNGVMKHGATRDRLRQEHGVLCFEMEAASLMNDFPCVVIRGICDYADSHKNKRWQEYAAVTAAAYAKKLLSAIPREQVANTPAISRFRNVYYLIPHGVSAAFTGRDDISKLLRETCLPSETQDGPRRFVLYGLGGSGKTQVCLKFAQDSREKFWGIFWIDASSNETAEQGFMKIAHFCKREEDFETTKMWLSNSEARWLLIVDNADDPSVDISRYFPVGNRGTILVTTRNPDCVCHATVGSWEFGAMETEDAITLLLKTAALQDRANDSLRTSSERIVNTLGRLALAIVQAGAFIREQHYSLDEYYGVYSRHRKAVLSRQPTQARSDYKYTIYTTWEVSVKMIEKTLNKAANNAIEILRFFSFLHFDGISEEILKEAWMNMRRLKPSEWTQSHQLSILQDISLDWDPYPLREAMSLLSAYSLIIIHRVGNHNDISMHPLVHMWARDGLGEVEQKKYWLVATLTLAMSAPLEHKSSDYQFRRSLLPHIDSCLNLSSDELILNDDGYQERLDMAFKLASVYKECGRPKEAAQVHKKLLEAQKRTLNEEHPDLLNTMNNLAASYSDLSRPSEAAQLQERVLEVQRRTLSEEHPDTLRVMGNLGVSYCDLGRPSEAAQLQERVLEAQKRTLGEEHPDTLRTINNLANSYNNLGRLSETTQLQERVLEVRRRTLGKEHPDTLRVIDNLAISYYNLSRPSEAARLQERVLEVRRRTLGEEHPDTLRTINNLANSYRNLGRPSEAAQLHERVLEVRRRTLGEEHPNTLRTIYNLAISYHDLSRPSEAVQLQERVLEVQRRTLGEEHPDTLRTINGLASGYRDLGRSSGAAQLQERILEVRRRTLSEEHPDTLRTIKRSRE